MAAAIINTKYVHLYVWCNATRIFSAERVVVLSWSCKRFVTIADMNLLCSLSHPYILFWFLPPLFIKAFSKLSRNLPFNHQFPPGVHLTTPSHNNGGWTFLQLSKHNKEIVAFHKASIFACTGFLIEVLSLVHMLFHHLGPNDSDHIESNWQFSLTSDK